VQLHGAVELQYSVQLHGAIAKKKYPHHHSIAIFCVLCRVLTFL
jgi:hypothetical protein